MILLCAFRMESIRRILVAAVWRSYSGRFSCPQIVLILQFEYVWNIFANNYFVLCGIIVRSILCWVFSLDLRVLWY